MGRQQGHRQKGAGAVTVSRGDQMRQGVLCKEWQRTPMQLLQEYCQSKKRRNPIYHRVKAPEDRFRMRCVLPDDKNSAKDLKFSPEQDFETQDEAKHCAALLALKYLEPARPLERKLPDPFRELWLAMGSATETTSAAPAKPTKGGKKKEAAKAPTAKEPAQTAVASEAAAEGGMDLWQDAPDSPRNDKPKKKSLELTSDRKFASHAEYVQAQLERTQEKNRRSRARENHQRANMYKQVLMSAGCRDMIESVLRQLGTITGDVSDQAEAPAEVVDHTELYEKVSKELASIGFQPRHIQGAIQACKKEPDHSDSEYTTFILDWLCLNVPESALPKAFNPEGTQLDVLVSGNASTEGSSSSAPALVQKLMKYGYDRLDASVVVQDYARNHPADDFEHCSAPMTLSLLSDLYPAFTKKLGLSVDASDVPDGEELATLRQDEIFALEAIYEERIQVVADETGDGNALALYSIRIQATDEIAIDVFLPASSKYPFELPIIGITSSNASHQPHLLQACGDALKSCSNMLGEPMLYEVCVTVDSSLSHNAKKTATEKLVLLEHKKRRPVTAQNMPEEKAAPPPVPARTNRSKPNNNKKGQQRSQLKSGPNPKAIRELSDKLLNLQRKKDDNPTFKQMQTVRATLPAAKEKENLISSVRDHQVVLVCGQTGCGKTTQVPQFILDEYIDSGRGGECNIVCTQPRRIAAIGVATRVSQERAEDIADVVGYQVRMDAKKSANTRLLFCTTGVLLRRLLSDRYLSGVSHVVVDEVHERNIDTDFLLSILRELLPKRPDLRLILMSATMDSSLFVKYFSTAVSGKCPVMEIPGFTYPVKVHFLEDVLASTNYQVPAKMLANKKKKGGDAEDNDAPKAKEKTLTELTPAEVAERVDESKIHYEMYAHLVTHLIQEQDQPGKKRGAILVFLPGTAEIKRMIDTLNQSSAGSQIWALPLHGSLSGSDQALVFKSPPSGKTKVIVSTNIAETSITINDITAVIDCGKVKEMVYDNRQKRSQLLDCWSSQAACDQRKGRAGRVQAGSCYRMYTRQRFEQMDAQLSAEIHRVSLEQLCLQIKKLELGSIKSFLNKAIEPPAEDAVDSAINELLAIQAFKKPDSSSKGEEAVLLTPLGSHLAMLPLDARIGKFLIYGSILRCVDPVAIIAASISSKNPFIMSMNDPELKERQEAIKKQVGGNWKSDHLLLWKLVEMYQKERGQKLRRGFCREHGLSYETMETIVDLKDQYLQQMDTIGFYDYRQKEQLNLNSGVPRIIKAALCAGLYANVIQVVYPEQKYFQSAHGVFTEEHDAKKIRYFVQSPTESGQRERVFLHPSSCNFTQTQYDTSFLLYTELVQTSKVFVRESTMSNPYALLLFGGQLDVVHEKNLLVIDKWIHFQAVARIGVLIKSIRRHLDQMLSDKIARPELDISSSELVTAISHLLKSEGM